MAFTDSIQYGSRTFTGKDISKGAMRLAASLPLSSLEVNTFTFVIHSTDTSLVNFKRNDKITYYRDGKQHSIYFLQTVERIAKEAYRFTASSAIGLLSEGLHFGGIYNGVAFKDVLAEIMGTIPYYLKLDMQEVKVYGWLPIATPRDNLIQLLFATGATVKTDLDGYLRIEPFWDSISSDDQPAEIYIGANVEYGTATSAVNLTEHQYSQGGNVTTLYEGVAEEGDTITFSEPMYALQATGFRILRSGANYAVLSAGNGILTGRNYVHNTRIISGAVSQTTEPNVKKIDSATLISYYNSHAVAQRMIDYYRCTETIAADVIYKGERPGDVVRVYHPYLEKEVDGTLLSVDMTLSGVLRAKERILVGYAPPRFETVETYDFHQILTGSGTWNIPAGTTSVRAVLIGGGAGGYGGYDGEAGGSVMGYALADKGGSEYIEGSPGGNGGAAGMGGAGAKVAQVDISLEGVSSLRYTCGTGGAGGAVNGGAGIAGTDTTLTAGSVTRRSSEGSASPLGYTDAATGTVYALPGAAGYAGGAGGNGGTHNSTQIPSETNSKGGDGGDAGGYAGGKGCIGVYVTSNQAMRTTYSVDSIGTNYRTVSTGTSYSQSGYRNVNFDKYTGKASFQNPDNLSASRTSESTGWNITSRAVGVFVESGNPYSYVSINLESGNSHHLIVATTTNRILTGSEYYTSGSVTTARVKGGCGGGGAAYGAAGQDAVGTDYENITAGAGASAVPAAAATAYGSGGNGGHGGGGGGGGGGAYSYRTDESGDYTRAYGCAGAAGGTGSAGSSGAPGCVILYYGTRSTKQLNGWLKTADGKFFNGRLKRRFVV